MLVVALCIHASNTAVQPKISQKGQLKRLTMTAHVSVTFFLHNLSATNLSAKQQLPKSYRRSALEIH